MARTAQIYQSLTLVVLTVSCFGCDVHEGGGSADGSSGPSADATSAADGGPARDEDASDAEPALEDAEVDAFVEDTGADSSTDDARHQGCRGPGGTFPASAPAVPCTALQPSGDVLIAAGAEGGAPGNQIRVAGERMLTQTLAGHWQLWDATRWSVIAEGDRCGPGNTADCAQQALDIAGASMAFSTPTSIEVHATWDGHHLGTIPRSGAFGLARDGGYVWTATTTALETWFPSGAAIASKPGDYAASIVWAGVKKLKVGAGPAGAHVVEFVSARTGASTTTSAFIGKFQIWFEDGRRFITTNSNEVQDLKSAAIRVYSEAVVEEKKIMVEPSSFTRGLEPLGGYGDYFWYIDNKSYEALDPGDYKANDDTFDLYQVSGPDTPIRATFEPGQQFAYHPGRILLPRPYPQNWMSIPPSNGYLYLQGHTYDLRGPCLREVARPLPAQTPFNLVAITNHGAMFGYTRTVTFSKLHGEDWRRWNCGEVTSVVAGPGNLWAIAFEGQTLIVDSARRAIVQTINHSPEADYSYRSGLFYVDHDMALSSDGTSFYVQDAGKSIWNPKYDENDGDTICYERPLYRYDVGSGALAQVIQGDGSEPWVRGFTVAPDAPRIALQRVRVSGVPTEFTLTSLDAGTTYASYRTSSGPAKCAQQDQGEIFFLSPSGQNLAVYNWLKDPSLDVLPQGQVAFSRSAQPIVWLTDERLLVHVGGYGSGQGEWQILNLQGDVVARPPISIRSQDPTIANSIDRAESLRGGTLVNVQIDQAFVSRIIDVASGQAVWSTPLKYYARANDTHVLSWAFRGREIRIDQYD